MPYSSSGNKKPKNEYEMSGVKRDSVQSVKDVTIASNFKFFLLCKEAACNATGMLGFIHRNFSFKNKDIILPMYISLFSPHLEHVGKFCSPHHAKDIAKLETVQRRARKIILSLRNLSYEERLARLNLFSLEKL